MNVGPVLFNIMAFEILQNYPQGQSNDQFINIQQGTYIGGHAIICVGWKNVQYQDSNGNTKTQFCWIIKNSWSSQWGVQYNGQMPLMDSYGKLNGGFALIASDINNLCGIEIGYAVPYNVNQNVTITDAQSKINQNASQYAQLCVVYLEPSELYLSADFDQNMNAIPDYVQSNTNNYTVNTNKLFIKLFDFDDTNQTNSSQVKVTPEVYPDKLTKSVVPTTNTNQPNVYKYNNNNNEDIEIIQEKVYTTDNNSVMLFGTSISKTMLYIIISVIALLFIIISFLLF